jgi:FkbM family methyltransferase
VTRRAQVRAVVPDPWLWRRTVRKAIRSGERELELVLALLDRGMHFVDVGANRGLYSRAAMLRGAHVTAVEPLPWLVDPLVRLVGQRGEVLQVAVGTQPGEHAIHIPTFEGVRVDTRSSLDPAANRGMSTEEILVRVDSLDHLWESWLGVDMVKIDVEGTELDVLRSGERLLSEARPALLIEVEARHHPDDPAAAFRLLRNLGYDSFHLAPESASRLVSADAFDFALHQDPHFHKAPGTAGHDPRYVNNFLFLPSERLHATADRLRRRGIELG